jgi:ankyrin repeat protein
LLVAERDNREGVTPLHSAALGACVRCVKALLEAGADPGLEDSEGKLAADLVAPQDAAQLAELLAVKRSGRAKAGAAKKAGRQLSPSKSAQQQFIDLTQVSWVDMVCAAVSDRFAHFTVHSCL